MGEVGVVNGAVVGAVIGGCAGMVAGVAARRLLAVLRRGARVRAPVCELATGAVWAITGCLWGAGRLPSPWLPVVLGLGWLGVAAGLVDLRHRRLPNALTAAAACLAPLGLLSLGCGCGRPRSARRRSPPSSATARCTCCGLLPSARATSSSPPHSARCSAPRPGSRSRPPPSSRPSSRAPSASSSRARAEAPPGASVPHGPSMLLRPGSSRWSRPAVGGERSATTLLTTRRSGHVRKFSRAALDHRGGVSRSRPRGRAGRHGRRGGDHHQGARCRARPPPSRLRPRRADEVRGRRAGGHRRRPARADPRRPGRDPHRQQRVAEVGDGDGGRPRRSRADREPGPQRAAHPSPAGPRRSRGHDEVRLRRRPARAGAGQRTGDRGTGGPWHGGAGVPQAGARRRHRLARRGAGRGRGARRRRARSRRARPRRREPGARLQRRGHGGDGRRGRRGPGRRRHARWRRRGDRVRPPRRPRLLRAVRPAPRRPARGCADGHPGHEGCRDRRRVPHRAAARQRGARRDDARRSGQAAHQPGGRHRGRHDQR